MELNIIAPNVTGGGDTLFESRSATGSLGDLILVNTANGKFNQLVDSGLVIDCTELVRDKDLMKNYGNAVKRTNELAGTEGIYGFPNSISSHAAVEPSEGSDPTFGPYIRWEYYRELGYPEMNGLEDFLDVLEQMQTLARKEGSSDIYAISLFKDWDYNMMNNAKQIACMYGYDELGFVLSRADGTDYQDILDPDSFYIKALRFFNEANARGLVDPDSASQNFDSWLEKYQTGRVLYSPWPWVGQSMYNNVENKTAGRGFKLAPVKDMQIFSFGCWPEGDSTSIIAIGSGAEDPGRLADFIDWLYTPEGFELNGQANGAAGPRGLTWELVEDGVGRAVMSHPKLLMLDEPSMGLAPILVAQIFEIIQGLHKAGTTILLVEQNAQAALSVADRGYVLETGKIVTSGSGQELLDSPAIKKAYLGG